MAMLRPLHMLPLLCLLTTGALGAQSSLPVQTLRQARSLYYTPVDSGLQHFRCEVSFDWKNLIQKASNQPVPDDDARLRYLQSVQLSVEDDLHGTGQLRWNAPAPPPEASADSVNRIREGMQQMWSGFFQSWNGFASGDLVTVDANATVTRAGSGYHVSVKTADGAAEENFDGALTLKSIHVATPQLDSLVTPTFDLNGGKLLVSTIESSYRQPPASPPTGVVMQVSYAASGTFQLPSRLVVTAAPATFTYDLQSCTTTLHNGTPSP